MEFRIQRYDENEEDQLVYVDKQSDLFQARIEERRKRRKEQMKEKIESSNDMVKKPKKKKKKMKTCDDEEVIVEKQKTQHSGLLKIEDGKGNDAELLSGISVTCSDEKKLINVECDIDQQKKSFVVGITPKKKKKVTPMVVLDNTGCNFQDPNLGLDENNQHKKQKSKKSKLLNENNNSPVMIDEGNCDIEKETPNTNSNLEAVDVDKCDNQNGDADRNSNGILNVNDNNHNVNGNYFPILGKHNRVKKPIVKRSLPRWLNEPIFMSADINSNKTSINEIDFLSKTVIKNLASNDIEYLFPVQHTVVEKLMHQNTRTVSKFPPRDICVQAPTGSGKTLAYVLPITDILSKFIVRQLYCLVVVPSKDLAAQVYKVFEMYTKGTHLKVALASGLKTFSKEQENLVTKGSLGCSSKVDIVVSTPGRLVDHLKQTSGFNLKYLRFLVVDEADRLLGQDYSSWLNEVKTSVHSPNDYHLNRPKPIPINASAFLGCQMPFQKLLFSATLTQNPEKLAALELFHPMLFTSKLDCVPQVGETENPEKIIVEDSDRFIIPEKLVEKMIVVEADQKPLVIVFLMIHMNWKGVLCFTNSIASTHRLCLLLQSFQGFTVAEFSSSLSETQRKGIIRDFNCGKVDLLISSDAMARGMDIDTVKLVVNYDTAANAKTYVHRVGRTARAGKEGCAITILHRKEVYHFKLMMKKLSGKVIPKLSVPNGTLKTYQEKYEEALSNLQDKISLENRNNSCGRFFRKT